MKKESPQGDGILIQIRDCKAVDCHKMSCMQRSYHVEKATFARIAAML
jgi:hypothetical protein